MSLERNVPNAVKYTECRRFKLAVITLNIKTENIYKDSNGVL